MLAVDVPLTRRELPRAGGADAGAPAFVAVWLRLRRPTTITLVVVEIVIVSPGVSAISWAL
jgi:hypothetical protein